MDVEASKIHHSLRPVPAYYRWTFPGSPIKIDIALAAVAEINRQMDRIPAKDISLFAGVLLGQAEQGINGPTQVKIDDFVNIQINPVATGISTFDQKLLEFVELHGTPDQEGTQASPVGYFRVQRDELSARGEDIEIIVGSRIPLLDVVLLILSGDDGERTAGFLFREGQAFTPFSLMEFPLDAEVLRTREPEDSAGITNSAAAEVDEHDYSLARPRLEIEGHSGVAVATVGGAERAGAKKRRRLAPAAIVITSLALIAMGVTVSTILLIRNYGQRADPASSRVSSDSGSQVQLHVEAQGNGLNLVWNPSASPVTNAASGQVVTTEDNQAQRVIGVDSQLLRNGRVFYVPSSERVRFCLELKDSKNQITNTCTLALLAPSVAKSGALPTSGKAPAIEPRSNKLVAPATTAVKTETEPKFQVQSQTPIDASQALEGSNQAAFRATFVPPEKAASPLAEGPTVVDPPTLNPSDISRPFNEAAQASWTNLAVVPPTEKAPSIGQRSSNNEQLKSGAQPVRVTSLINYQKAVAKYESLPTLDPVVRSMLFGETEIGVKVNIDEAGRVVRAEIVSRSKHSMGPVDGAALAAAKRWIFVPAKANGNPVPSEHLIQFRFLK